VRAAATGTASANHVSSPPGSLLRGAPAGATDAPASADAALAAARAIEQRLSALASRVARETGVEPVVHIGLHAGRVVSGEIGFRGASTRAAVGRAIDQARRLPEAARAAGVRYAITAAALAGASVAPAGAPRTLDLGGDEIEAWFADAVPVAAARTEAA
jgi:class 3 adenylate cyclase